MFRFRSCWLSYLLLILWAFNASGIELPDHLLKVDPALLHQSVHRSVPSEVPSEDVPKGMVHKLSALSLQVPTLHSNSWDVTKPAVPKMITSSIQRGVQFFDTIIKLDAPDADIQPILDAGGLLVSRYDEFVYMDLPASAVDTIARLPQVLAISGCHPPSPLNDTAVTDTNVTTVWNSLGLYGDGVVVGVIDSGIGWSHADFKHPNGTTRILGIWDQYGSGNPPSGFDYGAHFDSADINAGRCTQQDEEAAGGHGTHVTGTAAGNGLGTGNGLPTGRFTGVAPNSEIVFCKYRGEQTMVDAVNYCFQIADSVGKPIVVNLSQGWVFGPHDGTTLVEQTLNAMTGPDVRGKLLVFAAGNSGADNIYGHTPSLQAPDTENQIYPYLGIGTFNRPGTKAGGAEIYYSPQATLRAKISYFMGGQAYPVTDWVSFGSSSGEQTVQNGPLAGIAYQISNSPYANGLNNWHHIKLDFIDPQGNSDIHTALFIILLDGPGVAINAWHSWRDFGAFINTEDGFDPDPWRIEGSNSHTVAYPGNMDNAICVGSYVTRTQWSDIDGTLRTQPDATLGELSGFSSRGPRVDNAQKPDICAPGEALLSTLASNLQQVPRAHIEQDGVHQKMQGTSMAAPVVAGVVALMLQKNPNLNIEEARTIIRNTARPVGAPGWNPNWGTGKLDALAAINAVPGDNPTPAPTNTPGSEPPSPTPTATVPPQPTPTATTGPPPESLVVNSNDTPMAIPTDFNALSSIISVPYYLADRVTISLDLSHPDLSMLVVTLQAPDEGWVYITSIYQEIVLTQQFNVQGNWVLQILDYGGTGGTLNSWNLNFSGSPEPGDNTISCGQTVNSQLQATDEDLFDDGTRVNFWLFTLPSQSDVTIRMSAPSFTSYYQVHNEADGRPTGDPLFFVGSTGPGTEASTTQPLAAGNYVIVANNYEILEAHQFPAAYQIQLECSGIQPPTNTPVPPTDTPVPVATDTPVPPTDTPVPVATDTPVLPTNTPVSTPTSGPDDNTIACGQTVNGQLQLNDEDLFDDGSRVNLWLFNLPSQSDVTVRMSSAVFTAYFEVYREADGRPIPDERIFLANSTGPGAEAAATASLAAGNYVIIANNYEILEPHQFPAAYQLQLECSGPQPPTTTPVAPTNTPPALPTNTPTPPVYHTPTPRPPVVSDLNGDGKVNYVDLLIMLTEWHGGPNDL